MELLSVKRIASHKSAFQKKHVVTCTQQIEELLLAGCITEVTKSDIHVVIPWSDARNSVNKALILDL